MSSGARHWPRFVMQTLIEFAGLPIQGDVEQIIEGEGVVQRRGQRQGVSPGGFAAAVVQGHLPSPLTPALVAHRQVAPARLGVVLRGLHLNVGLRARHPLQVLQRLLHVAQVQHLAFPDGERIGQAHLGRRAPPQPDAMHTAWHHRQHEAPAGEVLRRGEHAGGDVASFDDGVLQTGHHGGDALGAEAAADGGIVARRAVHRADQPCKGRQVIDTLELDLLNDKTRGLVVSQPLPARGRAGLQAHIRFALQGLALLRLPLLLQLTLDIRVHRAGGRGLTPCSAGDQAEADTHAHACAEAQGGTDRPGEPGHRKWGAHGGADTRLDLPMRMQILPLHLLRAC